MKQIPLEDEFVDVINKTQRGLGLTNEQVASQAGLSVGDLDALKIGEFSDDSLAAVAGVLKLGAKALVTMAKGEWQPEPRAVEGLAMFNTVYHDMTVNAFVCHDLATKAAAVFDTGADASGIIDLVKELGLKVEAIFLTHTHKDHIADLERLKSTFNVPVYVARQEAINQAEAFDAGREFAIGGLKIGTRLTSGHAAGGITYVVDGLSAPIAVVGDAIFASSMGGGIISFSEALENNRKHIMTLPDATVLCPGHGPLTTVDEEKKHNPFFPEFQNY